MNPSKTILIILVVVCVMWPRLSNAADLTLAWDPASDGVTIGYILSYGTATQSYSTQIDVGLTTSYTVTSLTPGTTYYFALRAYDAAHDLSAPSTEVSATPITPIVPVVTSLALSSNVPSPQLVGTTVYWLAAAGGGVAPYQFQWSLYASGAWTSSPWGNSSNWTWSPSTAGSDYQIKVAVRSAGDTNPAGEMTQIVPFVVNPTVSSANLVSNLSAPQTVGTTILWSASGTGGVTPYQYKWWLYNGSTWTAMTGWTTNSTQSWTPTLANTYTLRVWIRSAGSSVDAPEASSSVPFAIKGAAKGKKK